MSGSLASVRVARPTSVSLPQTWGVISADGVVGRPAAEDLERERHPGPADGTGVGHGGPDEALLVEQLRDEAPAVRPDDRHKVRLGGLERVHDDAVGAGGPDPVVRLVGREERVDLFHGGRRVPVGLGLEHDLDVRKLGERTLHAGVALGVDRVVGLCRA